MKLEFGKNNAADAPEGGGVSQQVRSKTPQQSMSQNIILQKNASDNSGIGLKPQGQGNNKDQEKAQFFTKLRQMHREQQQAKNGGKSGPQEGEN